MKTLKKIIPSLLSGVFLLAVVTAPSAGAIDIFQSACQGAGGNAVCDASEDSLATLLGNIISTMFVLVGIIAVIMIIVGGIRYITSNGEASAVSAAKNTILYSVVGLVVALASFAIVNFVLGRIGL